MCVFVSIVFCALNYFLLVCLINSNSPLKLSFKSHPHLLERDNVAARYIGICILDFLLTDCVILGKALILRFFILKLAH